jgi:hypothetical protein
MGVEGLLLLKLLLLLVKLQREVLEGAATEEPGIFGEPVGMLCCCCGVFLNAAPIAFERFDTAALPTPPTEILSPGEENPEV